MDAPIVVPGCKTPAGMKLKPRRAEPSMFDVLSWPGAASPTGPRTGVAPVGVPAASCKPNLEEAPAAVASAWRGADEWISTYDDDFRAIRIRASCDCGADDPPPPAPTPARSAAGAPSAYRNAERGNVLCADPEADDTFVSESQYAYRRRVFADGDAIVGTTGPDRGEWVVVDPPAAEETADGAEEESAAASEGRLTVAELEAQLIEAALAAEGGETPEDGAGEAEEAEEAEKAEELNRVMSDTKTARLQDKPVFHLYGNAAIEPTSGGVLYGAYMRSFNKTVRA